MFKILGILASISASIFLPSLASAATFFESGGLKWVSDPNITFAYSRSDLESNMGVGGFLEDYRYATLDEFNNLLTARYAPILNGPTLQDSYLAVRQMIEDFGLASYVGASVPGTQYETWTVSFAYPEETSDLEASGYLQEFYHTQSTLSCETDSTINCEGGSIGFYFDNGEFGGPGHFSALIYEASSPVTPVPLPASGVLFIAGLGSLALARRRRH